MLPPRGSFVIVKFSTSLNLSRNININVRSLYHMILENVCMDVCVCVFFFLKVRKNAFTYTRCYVGLDHFWQYLLKPPADVL